MDALVVRKKEMDALKELYKELDYPSSGKLYTIAKQRGLDVKAKEVTDFVRGTQAPAQVFAQEKAPRTQGHISANSPNERFQADLIDQSAKPDGDWKYILCVVDVFTRKVWLRAMRNKQATEAARAFNSVLNNTEDPDVLSTDADAAFGVPNVGKSVRADNAFQELLDGKDIIHRVKRARNDIALVDSAIAKVRQTLAKIMLAEKTKAWAALVPRVQASYNKQPHSALHGSAPDDAKTKPELEFMLLQDNAEKIEENDSEEARLQRNLKSAGAFRAPIVPKGQSMHAFQGRVYNPRYEGKVRTVASVERGEVEDEDGNKFPSKLVLPVHPSSETVEVEERRVDARKDVRNRADLQQFVAGVVGFLGAGSKTIKEVGIHLNAQPEFKTKIRAARVKQMQPIIGFLRVFPDRFKVTMAPTGGQGRVSAVRKRLRGKQ